MRIQTKASTIFSLKSMVGGSNLLSIISYLLALMVIDLENKVTYKKNWDFEIIFKVMRTDQNYRARSQLSIRKSFDSAAVF